LYVYPLAGVTEIFAVVPRHAVVVEADAFRTGLGGALALQAHWPPEHDMPVAVEQGLLQPPQWLLLVLVLTQPAAPQSTPDEQTHRLFWQVFPVPH
jgi:hypothetical protein